MDFDFQSFLNRKKLKQREASEMLGVSMGLVGSWASGRAKPSYETIVKLIDAGATVEELFGKENAEKLAENSKTLQTSPPTRSDLKAVVRELMNEIKSESGSPNS